MKLLTRREGGWLRSPLFVIPSRSKLVHVAYSFADQALAVGGGFLVNVALARTQSKEDGIFALSYSVFAFLLGLYYAAILEPFTVYASGRYREHFSEYLQLMVRSDAILGCLLTAILLLSCGLLSWAARGCRSRALWGLALSAGVLLSGYFLRRVFYVQRQPRIAARSSLVFFVVLAFGVWLLVKAQRIDRFTVFVVLAFGWIVAGAVYGRKFHLANSSPSFLAAVPGYWGTIGTTHDGSWPRHLCFSSHTKGTIGFSVDFFPPRKWPI